MRPAGFALVFALGASTVSGVSGVVACNSNTATSRSDEPPPAVATSQVAVTVRSVIVWPAASTVDDTVLASLAHEGSRADEVRALVSRSPVPVLAPKNFRLTAPTLVVEGEYFAL